MRASEGDTDEVLSSWYECNYTPVVVYKATREPLPRMLILQGPVPIVEKYQWTCIGGFTDVLDSNTCRINDRETIIKHYHCVLKPWQQNINVSARIKRKELLTFYGSLLHLKIDLLKYLREGECMVVLICMKTRHTIACGGSGYFWYLKERIPK